MSTFLDDLLKKMKTAPHVGVPSVTNPKLPTKVERETAEYAARQKSMPNFKFGSGHPSPTYADPKFNNDNNKICISKALIDAWESEFQEFFKNEVAKKAKQTHDTQKKV